VGDLALVTFGKVLRQAMRENDIVGRYGGDEFTILLPHTASEGAEQVAQRIYDALRSKFVDGAGTTWPLRASIGIATLAPHEFRPEDFVDPVPQSYFQDVAHDLIGAADAALYRAKHAGKDRFCVAEPCAWPPLPAGD
jgi:diguanylate cyclase (GGDEF)-like protein